MSGQEDSELVTWSILFSPNTTPYLPPEVWAKIFRKLPAKDLLSVSNACEEWEELLASEKKFALLEQTLPLLDLDTHDILTLREISKCAKQSVDNQLQTFTERERSFKYEYSTCQINFNDTIQEIGGAYDFSSFLTPERSAQDFFSQFGDYQSSKDNPILTRSLSINIISFRDDEYYTIIMRILTLFGNHVWALNVDMDVNSNDVGVQLPVISPMKKLPQLLHLLPNLKSLEFSSPGTDTVFVERLQPEELPELKHLDSLSFELWENGPYLSLTFLRRYGPQLTRWKDSIIHSTFPLAKLTVEVLNELLPNLKTLDVYGDSASLQKLAKVNWQLEDLTVGTTEQWKLLFDVINNFSQTLFQLEFIDGLNSLSIPWKDTILGRFSKSPAIAMPKLEVLCLNLTFVKSDKHDWFWKSVRKMWGNIRTLHVNTNTTQVGEGENLDDQLVNGVFQKLPNLERIVVWWVGILLNIHTRPDQL